MSNDFTDSNKYSYYKLILYVISKNIIQQNETVVLWKVVVRVKRQISMYAFLRRYDLMYKDDVARN